MKQHFSEDYSVLTFATNKLSYLKLAFTCARSILLFNNISIYIVSDLPAGIPPDLREKVFIIPAKIEHTSLGTGMKLYIDKYLQTTHTLFIDSDCICYDNLNKIFNTAIGMAVSVAGNIVTAASWTGEAQANTIQQHFCIDQLIRYNGGLYYMNKSELTNIIFAKARDIAKNYDGYGFQRIKNKWINEEAPLSIAMMLNHQKPMPDNGQYMTDLYTDSRPHKLNVLKGIRQLNNPDKTSLKHRPWYPANYSPVILHFGGSSSLKSYPYNAQYALLKLNAFQLPVWLCSAIIYLGVSIPFKIYYWLSNFGKKINPVTND